MEEQKKFPALIRNFEDNLSKFQSNLAMQMEEFQEKQKKMIEMELQFEKALLQENEKFTKKMKENREKIQKESQIEDLLSKQSIEFKRKPSLKAFQQQNSNSSPEYKPIYFNKRQSSSRGLKKPIKLEEKFIKKLVLTLIKAQINEYDTAFCEIILKNTKKSIQSQNSEKSGDELVWNQNFEIEEEISKELSIEFYLKTNNIDNEEVLIGVSEVKIEVEKPKKHEFSADIIKDQETIGKIFIQIEIF